MTVQPDYALTWILILAVLAVLMVMGLAITAVLVTLILKKRPDGKHMKMLLAFIGILGLYNIAVADETPAIADDDQVVETAAEAEEEAAADITAAEETAADDVTEDTNATTADETTSDAPSTSADEATTTGEAAPASDEATADDADSDPLADVAAEPAAVVEEPAAATSEAEAVEAINLTIEPNASRVTIDPGRPEWVESENLTAQTPWISVGSDHCKTTQEATDSLETNVVEKTKQYIDDLVGTPGASERLHLTAQSPVIRRVFNNQNVFKEIVHFEPPIGDRHQYHAQVSFDNSFYTSVKSSWESYMATRRLLFTTVGSLGVLLFIGIAFSFLKLDSATRGYYTGRLQFVATIAILAIIASGALLAKWIHSI